MTDIPVELRDLIARNEIRERIVRLARGEDRRDADLVRAAFWPDAHTDFGIFAGPFEEYLAWVVPGSPAVPVTSHVLGQTLIELKGTVGLTETHVSAYHRVDDGAEQRDVLLGGRYLDRFEQRDGEWRIAQRTMLYDWTRDLGIAADWSRGVMGAPLHGKHFTGRSLGDHSEVHFGK